MPPNSDPSSASPSPLPSLSSRFSSSSSACSGNRFGVGFECESPPLDELGRASPLELGLIGVPVVGRMMGTVEAHERDSRWSVASEAISSESAGPSSARSWERTRRCDFGFGRRFGRRDTGLRTTRSFVLDSPSPTESISASPPASSRATSKSSSESMIFISRPLELLEVDPTSSSPLNSRRWRKGGGVR